MPFISIQLNSNRPDQIALFFDSVEQTADAPEDIEILLHIDTGDSVMEQAIEQEKTKRRFTLHILQTSLVQGYATLWKPLNPLLKLTHPDVYFVINLSDEMLFCTKGWDSILRKYKGYYPDDIFRLRASKYRFRNYTDFWECGFAPDSLAFYTRKWLELGEDWNPCLGPDSFQQCVAFYLYNCEPFSHTHYNRDIPLIELEFKGEGAGIGLEGIAKYKRMIINNRAWFVLMSHKMQQEAKRRAIRLKSHIIAHAHGGAGKTTIHETPGKCKFSVTNIETKEIIATSSYRLSWLRITLTNLRRMFLVYYYAGGGKEALKAPFFGLFMMLATFTPLGVGAIRFRDISGAAKGRIIKALSLAIVSLIAPFKALDKLFREIQEKLSIQTLKTLRSLKVVNLKLIKKALPTLIFLKNLTPHIIKKYAVIAALKSVEITRRIRSRKRNISLKNPLQKLSLTEHFRQFRQTLFAPAKAQRNLVALNTLPVNTVAVDAADRTKIVFSIQFSSNRPHQVTSMLDNIEKTADNPSQVEILVHIDSGDTAMEALLKQEQSRRKVTIKYLATDLVKGFTQLWKAYNPLFKLTGPDVYWVTLFSDEMRFATKGWDSLIMQYAGYYPDNIFRLRGSVYRFRNYTDFWECGFAPDSLAFYTRPWLELQGDWNPCTGPDSFQQSVAYQLYTSDAFSHTQYMRDIPMPFIAFGGEGASVGLEGEAKKKRVRDNNQAWFVLMSPQMQQNARRRAMHLKAAIMVHAWQKANPADTFAIMECPDKKTIIITKQHGTTLETLPYSVSFWKTRLTNLLRAPWVHYYAGGGIESLKKYPGMGMRMMIDTYSPYGRQLMEQKDNLTERVNGARRRLIHTRNHIVGTWKYHGFFKGTAVLTRGALRMAGRAISSVLH